jgi:hypothetical protein
MKKPIFFRCEKCQYRLRADEDCAGEFATCPQCQAAVEVPDPDGGPRFYSIAGEPETTAESSPNICASPAGLPRKAASSTDVWRPEAWAEAPPEVRSALNQAQAFGEAGQEVKALALLLAAGRNRLFDPENRPLWRPSALCLVRWAQKMLDWLEEQKVTLSKPLRRLLKIAAEKQRWGGTFNFRECALCEGPLGSLHGRAKVNTAAGVAYLCCAAPTKEDFVQVRLIDTIWQAVSLAGALDPDNRDVPITLEALPAWHKVLVTSDTRSFWCGSSKGEGEPKPDDLALGTIDRWLAERGFASEAFLMRVYLRLASGSNP